MTRRMAPGLAVPQVCGDPGPAVRLAPALLEAVADQLAAGLEVAVGDPVYRAVEAEAGLPPREVELVAGTRIEAEPAREALAVEGGEVHRHVADLTDAVERGGQRPPGTVEDNHVLAEPQPLLGRRASSTVGKVRVS